MPIKRRGARVYFYRNAREGGRVASRYVAAGPDALAVAEEALRRRREALARRRAWEAERAAIDAQDAAAGALCGRVDAIVRDALEAAGFHRHRRGEWRRRRKGSETAMSEQLKSSPPADADARLAVLRRARDGDKTALPALEALLDGDPRAVERCGNLAAAAEEMSILAGVGLDLVRSEAVKRKMAALRAELAGPRPTPIERLLAERAALCWLTLYRAENAEAATSIARDLRQAEYFRKRIDSAHRRYLSALKALATVRKLALPALQVNVAENQVVIGGT